MSGGQRQRICLARCLYSTAPIVILDSPFSALDNKIVSNILEDAIRNILLRKKRTVILTTDDPSLLSYAQVRHPSSLLRSLITSQHVIVLDNGRVTAQGTPKDVEKEFPQNQNRSLGQKIKTANERWRLLKTITRCGMVVKNSIENRKKQQQLFPTKQSVQDVYLPRINSRKLLKKLSR